MVELGTPDVDLRMRCSTQPFCWPWSTGNIYLNFEEMLRSQEHWGYILTTYLICYRGNGAFVRSMNSNRSCMWKVAAWSEMVDLRSNLPVAALNFEGSPLHIRFIIVKCTPDLIHGVTAANMRRMNGRRVSSASSVTLTQNSILLRYRARARAGAIDNFITPWHCHPDCITVYFCQRCTRQGNIHLDVQSI